MVNKFVKTLAKRNTRGFEHIVERILKITQAKLKAFIFVRPLEELDLPDWNAFN